MDMNKITKPFDEFMTSKFQLKNEYVVALVSLIVIVLISATAPKLPEVMAKWMDNVVVHILLFFLILWVAMKYPPSVAIVVAVLVALLMMAMNLYKKKMETMMTIGSKHMASISPYVVSNCGSPYRPCPEPKKEEDEDNVMVDGPISSVSDAEMESLCGHLKDNKKSPSDIVSSSDFSELVNAEQACDFAQHQFKYDVPDVACPDPSSVHGMDRPFPSQAPVGKW
jgi:hypothetical protein